MKPLNSDKRTKILISVIIFLLFLFANIYAVRKVMQYGTEVYFYDKMSVAYQIGGINGLKKEMETVLSQSKIPREIKLAKAFQKELNSLTDPGEFLKSTVYEKSRKISLFRNLRSLAFGAILGFLILRLITNKRKQRKKNA